jgi:putative DNA primase/helicase
MNDTQNTDFADHGIDIKASIQAACQIGPSKGITMASHETSEDKLATAFTHQNSDTLKYCQSAGRWFKWNGRRWIKVEGNYAIHAIRMFVREVTAGAKEHCKASRIKAIETLVRESPQHAVPSSFWDPDPMLLGTPECVVDLRSGNASTPNPDWAITKVTAVGPADGQPEHWLKFLNEATNGDAEMIRYIQQICGYALTGSTKEHALFFVYGPGGNGKSVFLNTVAGILGDYARVSSMETFTASKNDRHPTELAMLQGARLVTASETEEGRAWAEAKIKQLTGSDPISARYMRQDFFEFRPQFKLIIVGNHAPQLRTVDEAMKRRFNILPFIHKPTRPDRDLEQKLQKEWPKILNWMIEGCLEWQKNGLVKPAAVREATNEYFEQQDMFGQWLAECCQLGHHSQERPHILFESWSAFARENGEDAGNSKTFSDALKRQGCSRVRPGGVRYWKGIELRK